MICYSSSQNSTYLKTIESISLFFVTHCFATDKYIYDLQKVSITNTKKTFKDWDLSGVRLSF